MSSAKVEILTNKVKTPKFNKTLGIMANGQDNAYPQVNEDAVNGSITAKSCAELMTSYIVGRGFGDKLNEMIVNKKKGTTLLKLTTDIAESIVIHRGFYVHVNVNLGGGITSMDVIPFTDGRLGKFDDQKFNNKILVCDDWLDSKKAKKAHKFDVYNELKNVIEKQIENAGGIDKYKGQILYFKLGNYSYPLSRIHACYDDTISESKASAYKKTLLTKGFFGKTVVITKPLVNNALANNPKQKDTYNKQLSERQAFREGLKSYIGAENADGVMHVELQFETDEIDKEILFKNIESKIDDKLFTFTESSVRNNIRMSFNNVPALLIEAENGKMFGSSGEAIKEMKKFYQDQTRRERDFVQQVVRQLMSRYIEPQEKLELLPLISIKQSTGGADAERLKAQATLKGSVGGVTALLSIQQSVAAGTTDRGAAIAIIEEIFGIDKVKAGEILGTPKEQEDGVD